MNYFKYILIFTVLNLNAINQLNLKQISTTPNLNLIQVKEPIGGALTIPFLQTIKNLFNIKIFIETGTFLGKTTKNASSVFPMVHTIELSEDIFKEATEILKAYPNIKTYLGDSGEILSQLLLSLPKEKTLFWLDGHYSGMYFDKQTAMGKETTPILKELESIKKSNLHDAIILIDDIRVFDTEIKLNSNQKELTKIFLGYPSLNEVYKKLEEINPNYTVLIWGDVLLAYPTDNKIIPSSLLKACTISRSYDGKNYTLTELILAEEIIGKSKNSDYSFFLDLYTQFTPTGHAYAFRDGIGKHYILWYSLICLNRKDYKTAYQLSKNLQWKNWRVKWIRAKSALGLKLTAEARRLLKEIIQEVPNFTLARELYKKILRN